NLDLLLVQWDSAGNKVWNRTWSETNNDQGRSVWSDGIHIYTAGITDNPSTSSDDLLLIQWDTAGNLIWNRTWGTTSEEQGHSVWGDGTYIYTTGDAERPGTSDYDLLLVQWDSTGSIIRNWTLGGQKDDYSRSIWGDGIYIYTAGFTYSFKALGIDLLLVQWDFVPIASFNGNITDIIANEYVQFSFTGYEGSSSALFQWNFGDGTANSTLRDPVHQFTSAGNFTVTLTVTDIDGDIDILSMVDCINVAPDLIPIANWNSNASVILVDDAVSFTFTGTEGNVETSYEWNFGDDTGIFNNSDLIHTFSTAGNFTISLTVSDIDGDFDTRENTILVLIPSDDFDEDGLTNFQELRIYGTSATNRDTDGDDWSDKEEIDAGTDPLDPLDHPSRPPPGDTFWDLLFKQGIIIPIVGAIVTATVGIVIKRIRTKTKKRKKQAL
ncbi:MAG: PKD domain-containing protein, partial [Promethearchaeota archaeon]